MTPAEMIAAASAAAASQGYTPIVLGADVEGEAREWRRHKPGSPAMRWPAAGASPSCRRRIAVTIRGHGRGGPNQEFALALALDSTALPAVSALAADTDGTDGGAARRPDPAGAIIDGRP